MMVWTPDQTATFLQRAKYHRLYALYRLIAFAVYAAVWAPRSHRDLCQRSRRSKVEPDLAEVGER
jgi:hypothetical protein